MTSPDVSDQLRGAGLRVTAPRQAVLQWLAEHPHATAEQVRSGVAQRLGSMSTQAVYDVLAVSARPCLTSSDDHGYLLDEAEVVFWGRCPACQAAPDSSITRL